jgi:CHASE2 domain-containing sensor protein|tara:strand:- start:8826 stop:9101 length:276 start_codon:yes stop_codon:yes gene_type:complete
MENLSPEALTLLSIVAGGVVTGLTQVLKRYIPVHPLAVAAGISVIGGVGYAYLVSQGLWETVAQYSSVAFTGAVTTYEVFKSVLGSMDGDS